MIDINIILDFRKYVATTLKNIKGNLPLIIWTVIKLMNKEKNNNEVSPGVFHPKVTEQCNHVLDLIDKAYAEINEKMPIRFSNRNLFELLGKLLIALIMIIFINQLIK